MKESTFRPHLCKYSLNWVRKSSCRSELEHATSRSRRLSELVVSAVLIIHVSFNERILCFHMPHTNEPHFQIRVSKIALSDLESSNISARI